MSSQHSADFVGACISGDMEALHYCLVESDERDTFDLDKGLIDACIPGHLEVVKFLLTSEQLKRHADIHSVNYRAYIFACDFQYWDIVHFLLSLNGHQAIPFENTECGASRFNLTWAIENQYHTIVKLMMQSLYHNNRLVYYEHRHKVEKYCEEQGENILLWEKECCEKEVFRYSVETDIVI